ncbi:MAG TPA: biotin carboxylase N-terminal domain-containing protein [Steroidobacteraceae bacterium]|nr:biotin carboxylase N-terminal domain-containing protein [Steroidobacteraceae bacterium]
MTSIRRLLIANRGEIACRVIRTAKRLGITSLAVFSDADRAGRHVALADEALHIGPALAAQSYLSIDAVMDAARRSRADAVHPGYGFLAENAAFARECERAGIVWVGPPSHAIEAMGSKSAAKEMMARASVPVLPGYHGVDQSTATLVREAERVGFPIILKAVAGGGGKGMQIVTSAAAMPAAIESARRIAQSAFRSDALLLERYLAEPRHVEVQVFADRSGRVVHLFDRDCSVQRRHQKVIEEAPAPGVPDAVRAAMASAAVTVAATVQYVGAGTVEFLLDRDGAFYFMEMNTRLQVEHPVTEAVTGLDLVEWQLRVAAGESLPATLTPSRPQGHSIEARIYAEDPARDFLPSVGHIACLKWPEPAPGLRIDTGVTQGDEISPHYDPLIAKVIAHGPTRATALARLRSALGELRIAGVRSNAAFVGRILASDSFQRSALSTRLLENEGGLGRAPAAVHEELRLIAALWLATQMRPDGASPWKQRDGWRLNLAPTQTIWLRDGDQLVAAEVTPRGTGTCEVASGNARRTLQVLRTGPASLRLIDGGRSVAAEVFMDGRRIHVWLGGEDAEFQVAEPEGAAPVDAASSGALSTPLPGTVVAVEVKPGDAVAAGQTLLVVEAMKMEHTIRAPRAGTVIAVRCRVGERVAEGVALVELGEP